MLQACLGLVLKQPWKIYIAQAKLAIFICTKSYVDLLLQLGKLPGVDVRVVAGGVGRLVADQGGRPPAHPSSADDHRMSGIGQTNVINIISYFLGQTIKKNTAMLP